MDRQRGERLAAIMPVPHNHLIRTPAVESLYRRIDFTCKQRSQLRTFWIRLVLPANPGDALRIRDNENRLPRLRHRRGGACKQEQCSEQCSDPQEVYPGGRFKLEIISVRR